MSISVCLHKYEMSYLYQMSHKCSVADPDSFDPDPAVHFDTDPDHAFLSVPDPTVWYGSDPDPYSFKEVMYLKQYFVYIFTSFSLSVGQTIPIKKVFLF
jgi:hypothetical protein